MPYWHPYANLMHRREIKSFPKARFADDRAVSLAPYALIMVTWSRRAITQILPIFTLHVRVRPDTVVCIRQIDRLDLPEAVIAVCLEQRHERDDPQVLSRARFLAGQTIVNQPSTA